MCARLLRHVGFDHPHVVGHSYGGLLALELARRQIVALQSIALLEPATSGLLGPDEAIAGLAPLMELYRSTAPRGPSRRTVPPGSSSATTPAACSTGSFRPLSTTPWTSGDQFFRVELPAIAPLDPSGPADASASTDRSSTCSAPRVSPDFVQAAEIIQTLFPQATRYVLPGAGHLLMAQNPASMAERLEAFWSTTGHHDPG